MSIVSKMFPVLVLWTCGNPAKTDSMASALTRLFAFLWLVFLIKHGQRVGNSFYICPSVFLGWIDRIVSIPHSTQGQLHFISLSSPAPWRTSQVTRLILFLLLCISSAFIGVVFILNVEISTEILNVKVCPSQKILETRACRQISLRATHPLVQRAPQLLPRGSALLRSARHERGVGAEIKRDHQLSASFFLRSRRWQL